jgi:hypothetical protein
MLVVVDDMNFPFHTFCQGLGAAIRPHAVIRIKQPLQPALADVA